MQLYYYYVGPKHFSTSLEAAPPANLVNELPTVEHEGEIHAVSALKQTYLFIIHAKNSQAVKNGVVLE